MGLVLAAWYILFSCGICLATALASSWVGIMEPLVVLHRHTARDLFKSKYLLWRGMLPNGHLVKASVTIYCCGIKHDPKSLYS